MILNIPIPVIFISQDIDVDDEVEAETARYTVIDGQQRLTAIHGFLRNRYELEGLSALPELNSLHYSQLPPFLIRRLEERTIRCLRIDSTVDAQVKFDIFERLNTGSVKLEAQELRNATARGPFNSLIKDLAKTQDFRSLLQVDNTNPNENAKVQKMEDVELVLRFFSLKNGRYKHLKKGFKEFLTQSMNEFNSLSAREIDNFRTEFTAYMSFFCTYAGKAPFAKWKIEGDSRKRMSTFNAAVYDAVAVGLSEAFCADQVIENPGYVWERLSGYEKLFMDKDFFASVSGSVNDSAKVTYRIEEMKGYLQR